MCPQMTGSDPDDLDRLAHTFDQRAQALDSTAGRVRAQVQASPWRGAVADRFRTDWDSSYAPRLRQVSSSLRAAAKKLRIEADDQRQASGVRSSGVGGSAISGSGRGARDPWAAISGLALGTAQGWEDLQDSPSGTWPFRSLDDVLGAVAALGANSSLVGRYGSNWSRLVGLDGVGGFFRYKQSLNGFFSVNGIGEKISNVPGLSKLGLGLGLIDLSGNLVQFAGDPSIGNGLDGIQSALKLSPNPVVYLSGVAMSSVHMAADAAAEADFSEEGRLQVTDYLASQGPVGGTKVVVEEVAKATVEVFTKRIWDIF